MQAYLLALLLSLCSRCTAYTFSLGVSPRNSECLHKLDGEGDPLLLGGGGDVALLYMQSEAVSITRHGVRFLKYGMASSWDGHTDVQIHPCMPSDKALCKIVWNATRYGYVMPCGRGVHAQITAAASSAEDSGGQQQEGSSCWRQIGPDADRDDLSACNLYNASSLTIFYSIKVSLSESE